MALPSQFVVTSHLAKEPDHLDSADGEIAQHRQKIVIGKGRGNFL